MTTQDPTPAGVLGPATQGFYVQTLRLLGEADIPFLLGGAYALARYTGIERHTKDLDLFTRPTDAPRLLAALRQAGYGTEVPFPHWLGKAHHGEDFVDVIYASANGVGTVDDAWFSHAPQDEVFGVPVRLVPAEEMLWHKAYVCERERYDGADVAHLLRARAGELDWARLLERFGPHWPLLLSHLVMFGFVYPGERGRLPAGVLGELLGRLGAPLGAREVPEPDAEPVCQGTLISREQYLPDVNRWGYRDARLTQGFMTPQDVARWTAAIGQD